VKRAPLDWFELRFPQDLSQAAVTAALTSFTGLAHGSQIKLLVNADEHGVEHRLATSKSSSAVVLASLYAAVPSLRLEHSTTPELAKGLRVLWQLSPAVATINSNDPASSSASLLANLVPLSSDEVIRLQWTLRPAVRPRLVVTPEQRSQGQTQALKVKLAQAGLAAYGELWIQAASRRRRGALLQRVATTLRSLSSPHGRLVADPPWEGQLLRFMFRRGRFFSVAELAAVIGWPIDGPDLPGVELGAAKRLVPSRALPRTGRLLGYSNTTGLSRPVALTPMAATRGLYILGPTGTGKTSLIKNLVRDEMRSGRGLAVVETNGDLIQDLLELIPPERVSDVVLIDPTDRMAAVGFNPLASNGNPSLVADQLNELFQRLWAAYWGPRTAQLAHMGLLTLAQRPGSSLLDLGRLFLDPAFRLEVLRQLDDPIGLGPDWQWFERLPEREQATVVAPLLNKVRQFTARPAIRAIIGQSRPAVSMRQIVAQRRILLVYLPKGLIGAETAQLLGCLILTSLWQTLTQRAELSPAERQPFSLDVDEVQDFAAAPIPWDEMFAQGRKYGLALTVAHQNLDQLPKELREVILANARSKAVFALSASDARSLERLFGPSLTAADLQALDAHSIAALVALDDGSTARPVTLTTPPPPEGTTSAAVVRLASQTNFARSITEVEAELRRQLRATAETTTAPVGRKPRRPQ
jgi:hypothetical protein